PNTVLDSAPELGRLCERASVSGERIAASPLAKKRFVVRRGKLVPLPSSPLALAASPLFSLGAKLRLLREPFVPRPPAAGEETVAEFTRRRLGREILDYAVAPFVGGVFAGDPERTIVRWALPKLHALEARYGSLVRGAIAKRSGAGPRGGIFSLRGGLD